MAGGEPPDAQGLEEGRGRGCVGSFDPLAEQRAVDAPRSVDDADDLHGFGMEPVENEVGRLDQNPGLGGDLRPGRAKFGKAFQDSHARVEAVIDAVGGRRII